MDDVLSKERLQLLIGDADLEQARYLELKVDSRKIGLGHLSKFIPKVKQLKLNNSFVPMVRDIGHGYNNLTVLWMARCNLSDLDGIQSIRGLKELYLAFNNISEISAVGMLDQLEILDLESNDIKDVDEFGYLTVCYKLHHLMIHDNPIGSLGSEICKTLPQVQFLDDVQINKPEPSPTPIERPSTAMGIYSPAEPARLRPHTSFARKNNPPEKLQPILPEINKGPIVQISATISPTRIIPIPPKSVMMLKRPKMKQASNNVELSAHASDRLVGTLGTFK